MKQFLVALLLLIAGTLPAIAQQQIQHPPIIFGEIFAGATNKQGFAFGPGINYQTGIHLFSARFTRHSNFASNYILPEYQNDTNLEVHSRMNEWAVLYGPRLTFERFSVSLSAGVSQNYVRLVFSGSENFKIDHTSYTGIPYELNIKLYKKYKKPRLPFGLETGTKPTSFGNSVGLKVFGNFSGQRYIGLGLSFGLGVHKIYTE